MTVCDEQLCTGCGACSTSCPKKCIKMTEDTIGHLYPHINEKECINCGRCQKVCPAVSEQFGQKAKKVYACWSKDNNERISCTSGGIATVLGRFVISKGGVVYGSALTPEGIKHIRVDNIDDLEKLKGSKYVQSPIAEIYTSLKSDLEKDYPVLFIGTPCQCAGVKNYLGKEYDNLIAADLICTGVPPQKLLWENLGYSDKLPDKIRFRDETTATLTVWEKDNIVYRKPVYDDYFLMSFSKHLDFRQSCYNCKFAARERLSDITLGDFWGLGKSVPFGESQKGGVSAVFVNTDKGAALFDDISGEIFFWERELNEAIGGNPRYCTPSAPHKNREKFIALYKQKGFKKAIKRTLRRERIRYFIYRKMRRLKNL